MGNSQRSKSETSYTTTSVVKGMFVGAQRRGGTRGLGASSSFSSLEHILSKPVLLETFGIICATSSDIQKHRSAIARHIEDQVRAAAMLGRSIDLNPDVFATTLLDQILALAEGNAKPGVASFREFLASGGSELHLAVDDMLMSALRAGLGDVAKPMLLNAWSAAYWLLIATYRVSAADPSHIG